MKFTIERITETNYHSFADMTYWRKNTAEIKCDDLPSDMVKNHLADKNFRVYAAMADDKFVGWIALVFMPKISWTDKGFVYVDELWVQEDYRREGIATALMAKADQYKNETNALGIRLYVNINNPGAKELYIKCGMAMKALQNLWKNKNRPLKKIKDLFL